MDVHDPGASVGLVRAAEWTRLREFAVHAPALRAPALLAVTGEAGAGKSTLWRAAVAAAGQAGCRVLRSEPAASEADASFVGLSDLLADVLPAVAAGIPGPQREALEVALLLRPAGGQPPGAHAIGLAVLTVLRSCLKAGPVLIAIDDVQWLDAGSLGALTFALRRLADEAVSLLLAARTEAPADPLTLGAPPVPDGWRDLLAAVPGGEHLALAPLDARQVRELLPPEASAAQARQVARQSRGNPFWAGEVWASLGADDGPVPPAARALADRLYRSLTSGAGEALAVVAAAGRIAMPDALAVLGHLAGPAAALDEAVLAGLVTENAGRLTATHPLIAAAAVESIPPGRRSELYRQLAQASGHPERYAYFAALAAGPGPDPAVADALDAAALAAHARAANAAAAQFAIQAVAFTPAEQAAALARRHVRAGEFLLMAGDHARSLSHLTALDMSGLAVADFERALPLLTDVTDLTSGQAAAAALVAHWVDAVGDDPRRRALVLALASDFTYGVRGRREALAADAIACAETAGPAAAPALHRALVNLAVAKVAAGKGLDAGLLARAERMEPDVPVVMLHDTAGLNRGLWSRFVEDIPTARTALRRSVARAREVGEDYTLVTFLSYLAATEMLAGDYTAAADALAAAREAAAWHDWEPSPWHLLPQCHLLIARGELDEALALAGRHLPGRTSLSATFVGALVSGEVSFWRGDASAAAASLGKAARSADDGDWADPGVRSRVDVLLAEAYVGAGRLAEAARISAWLRETGLRLGRPALTGDAARIDALAAAAGGDLAAAATAARAAVADHEASPLRLELARSLLVLGQVERRRRVRGESRAALWRARELAAAIGHRPLLAQVERELPPAAAPRPDHPLTAAEQRVADQIAGGATSREAAAALFVSVRTVDTHVASIYRKLGVRTRSELRRTLAGRAE
jgi:DNA-binding CsgD family transcriptional regulator